MKYKFIYMIIFSAILIVSFQNCSNKLSFGISQFVFSSETKGNYYTNNNFMDVELGSENMDLFTEIRYSVDSQLDLQQWKTFSELSVTRISNQKINFRALLENSYKSDGSLDGEKVIYVGLRGFDRLNRNKIYEADFKFKMFLDTQAPIIKASDILQEGIKGRIFKLNQNVNLQLQIIDPNSVEFKASLFGEDSLRWAITKNGDCSEEFLSNKSKWMPVKDSILVEWPESDPLNAFYFCVFAKDKAGNMTSIMSPAMTSLWSTIAGDNSVGNGSGVNSPNVRFKIPIAMFLDVDRNLHFFDDGFGVRRMIMNPDIDSSRTVQVSNYPVKNSGIAVFDSLGNSYTQVGSNIVMNKKNETTTSDFLNMSNMTSIRLAIRNYHGNESLLIGTYMSLKANDLTAKAYIFELSLDKVKSLIESKQSLNVNDLISNYTLVGNGLIPNTRCTDTTTVCATIDYNLAENQSLELSNSDRNEENKKLNLKYSIGAIGGMTTNNEGDIFLYTLGDGSNQNIGQHTVRRLHPTVGGKFIQTILSSSIMWMSGINYFKKRKSPTEFEELLYITSVTNSSTVFNLSSSPITKNKIFQVNNVDLNEYNRGILVPNKDNSDFEYYIATGGSSRIYRFDSNGNLLETLGRVTSENSTTDPLLAVIGHPDGLAYDSVNDRLWITDSQYNMIYLLSNNQLNKVSINLPETNNQYVINYRTKIAFNSENQELYWSQFSGRILKVDTTNYSQQNLYNKFTGADELAKYDWRPAGIYFDQTNNSLLINRTFPITSNVSWAASYVGFIEKANMNNITSASSHELVFGNLLKGNSQLSDNLTTTIVSPQQIAMTSQDLNYQLDIDSNHLFYISNDKFKISNGVDKLRVLNIKLSGAIKVIEGQGDQSNIRYIIGATDIGPLQVVKININDLFNLSVNTNPIIFNKYLCLAGTKTRKIGTFISDKSGQLVFTDSGNARILKYLIRNAEGQLVIDQIAQTACQ